MLIYQECNFWGVPQGKLINRNCVLSQLDLNEQKNPTDQNVRCSPEFSIFLKFNLHFGHPPTEKNSKKQRNTLQITKPPKPLWSFPTNKSTPHLPPKKTKKDPSHNLLQTSNPSFSLLFFGTSKPTGVWLNKKIEVPNVETGPEEWSHTLWPPPYIFGLGIWGENSC